MKCNILPLINKFKLRNINPSKYPWGWRSQKAIRKILIKSSNIKYQPNMFCKSISDKTILIDEEFKLGCKTGYKTLFNAFIDNENFLKHRYTTPELSQALNYISKNTNNFNSSIELKNLESRILTSWIEIGYAKSNDKILGRWDLNYLKKELRNSNLQHCWDIYVGPLKQKVKVLYKIDNRIDIWEWERCLMDNDTDWTISNINEILIE